MKSKPENDTKRKTAAGGATATATPVNGQLLSDLPLKTFVRLFGDESDFTFKNGVVIERNHYGMQESLIVCRDKHYNYTYGTKTYVSNALRNSMQNIIYPALLPSVQYNSIAVPIVSQGNILNDRVFAFSKTELGFRSSSADNTPSEGAKITYFTNDTSHFISNFVYWANESTNIFGNDWTRSWNDHEGYGNNGPVELRASYNTELWLNGMYNYNETITKQALFGICLSPNARVGLTPNADGSYNLI